MADKSLVMVFACDQDYIKHINGDELKYAAQENRLFEAVSGIYIPLLNMFASLQKDGVPFKMALVLSPVVCTLLEDPVVQKQYISWLDRRIELGEKELERCSKSTDLCAAVKLCIEKAQEDKLDFTTVYNQQLVKKFAEYQKSGCLELLATCGTHIFMPHYSDMEEVLNAQVETGLHACRTFFGETPEGFWLPETGYAPGIEKVLRAYGVNYTVLDARSFLFSEIEPEKGIFYPARCDNSLAVFARDSVSETELYGENGFIHNKAYRSQNRDIGFELPLDKLKPLIGEDSARFSSGFRYWNKSEEADNDDEEYANPSSEEGIYDADAAIAQCGKDAEAFIAEKIQRLNKAEEIMKDSPSVSLVCAFDGDKMLKNWYEGIFWLEQVFRCAAGKSVQCASFNQLLTDQFSLQKIHPYYGADDESGYGEDFLSSKNCWMMRYIRKASERMIDLSERFPADTGLKARLLNLGAKELMLAQSCGWAKMLNDGDFPEYAEKRFRESILSFTTVFDSLGSNTVSTEWLTELENEHSLFPWMNYRIFSKKH